MLDRIGRTGRAGMKGESFTFLTSSGEDVWKAMGIVEVMQKTNQPVPPQVQVKPLFHEVWKKDVIQKTNLPHCLTLLKSR
jgi:superfamily II DNA/RNA helicase